MVTPVKNFAGAVDTWDDGIPVADFVRAKFAKGDNVTLSFAGVDGVTSSFINAALVSLTDAYSIDFIRAHLSVVHCTRQVVDMIRRCFDAAEKRARAA
jgi:hypothetical protein